MRVLVVHNSYQQKGGEDTVFASEAALLEAHGHTVIRYTAHNDRVPTLGRLSLARRTIWNGEAEAEVRALIRRERPDVMHVHNTLPLISPAIYGLARAEGVGVVQTLHNYRLLCPNALLFRDGRVCEECVGRVVPWPGVLHGCYRGSRAATGVVTAMLSVHRALGTWTEDVDAYISLSEFSRRKFVEGGLPPQKIHLKPNFVAPDPGCGGHAGGYALFVGRISPEKGLPVLLEAWRGLSLPLKIAGGMPTEAMAEQSPASIEWVGRRSRSDLNALMQDAAVLLFPSEVYEGFPMTIAEAFATGLPVIASGHGAMAEIVEDGRTGLHFVPGDAADLARAVRSIVARPALLPEMSRAARAEFEQKYTAARNHHMLMAIYRSAMSGESKELADNPSERSTS